MGKTNNTLRRDLSGIYIFDILPQDKGRRYPTCIEDCTENKRIEWLNSLEPEAVVKTAQHLNETFCKIWDMLTDEEKKPILKVNGYKPYCDPTYDKKVCVCRVNRFCKIIRYIADCTGICEPDSEAARNKPKSEDDE